MTNLKKTYDKYTQIYMYTSQTLNRLKKSDQFLVCVFICTLYRLTGRLMDTSNLLTEAEKQVVQLFFVLSK